MKVRLDRPRRPPLPPPPPPPHLFTLIAASLGGSSTWGLIFILEANYLTLLPPDPLSLLLAKTLIGRRSRFTSDLVLKGLLVAMDTRHHIPGGCLTDYPTRTPSYSGLTLCVLPSESKTSSSPCAASHPEISSPRYPSLTQSASSVTSEELSYATAFSNLCAVHDTIIQVPSISSRRCNTGVRGRCERVIVRPRAQRYLERGAR